jgi:hypothetical protein
MSDILSDRVDEGTPLLASAGDLQKPKRTPLPKRQIAIVLLLQICEPITSQSIYPYINAVSSITSNLLLGLILAHRPPSSSANLASLAATRRKLVIMLV